jgi:trehalose 6-phosphate synthase/phosphatase
VGIISTEHRLSESEEQQARQVLLEKKCYPVFMTIKEIQSFLMFYENLIKPKMHNFQNLHDDTQHNNEFWASYLLVNQKIAAKVVELKSTVKDLKVVWVHGDHLMLTPQFIRKSFSTVNLGFYFHSAFPASAMFSTIQQRSQILQSLLQSDMISFHLFEYARNFINSCERLLNLTLDYSSGGLMSVNFHGRVVGVRVSQIGIDEDFINHIMSSKEYKKWVERFKQEFKVIAEAARKSSVAGAGIGSRSTANFGAI